MSRGYFPPSDSNYEDDDDLDDDSDLDEDEREYSGIIYDCNVRNHPSSMMLSQNLDNSEDTRRDHHNKLERKRRASIKTSYTDLRDRIPNLRSTKSSRAVILTKAAEYLDELTREEDRLVNENRKNEDREVEIMEEIDMLERTVQQYQEHLLGQEIDGRLITKDFFDSVYDDESSLFEVHEEYEVDDASTDGPESVDDRDIMNIVVKRNMGSANLSANRIGCTSSSGSESCIDEATVGRKKMRLAADGNGCLADTEDSLPNSCSPAN